MWEILQSSDLLKTVAKLPVGIRERYENWKSIVRFGGPPALRTLRGLHDEALQGKWRGCRSSRLNRQYRVIYRVEDGEVRILVLRISAHDYRR